MLDKSAARVVQHSVGPALATPVEGEDIKAVFSKIANGFKQFFDVFGASVEQKDGSLAGRIDGSPMGVTHVNAVWCLHLPGNRIGRHRVEI